MKLRDSLGDERRDRGRERRDRDRSRDWDEEGDELKELAVQSLLHTDPERAVPILERLANEGTGSTFEAAARHTLGHIYNPDHGHTH